MHVISQYLSLRWALDGISLLQLPQASCLTCATQLDTIPHWHIYLIMLQLWNCLMHGFDWSRYVVMLNIYIEWCVYFSFRCSVNSICPLEYLAVKISIDRHKQRIDLTYGLQICSYIYIYVSLQLHSKTLICFSGILLLGICHTQYKYIKTHICSSFSCAESSEFEIIIFGYFNSCDFIDTVVALTFSFHLLLISVNLRIKFNTVDHNYANHMYDFATICHQVRCLRWGH